MSEEWIPPATREDADRRMAEARASLVAMTRDAFRGRGGMSRGEYLALFRDPERLEAFRRMFESAERDHPGVDREAAVAITLSKTVEFYRGIAGEAGLGCWEEAAVMTALHLGVDLALSPRPVDVAEAVAWVYRSSRTERLEPAMADEVRAVFDGRWELPRGAYLRSLRSPGTIESWQGFIGLVTGIIPGSDPDELRSTMWEREAVHRDAVASLAGLTPLERASYVGAVRRGFDRAWSTR